MQNTFFCTSLLFKESIGDIALSTLQMQTGLIVREVELLRKHRVGIVNCHITYEFGKIFFYIKILRCLYLIMTHRAKAKKKKTGLTITVEM